MIILFEYDKPLDMDLLFNYEAGLWYYQVTPTAHTITDDYGVVSYYEDTNILKWNIKSLSVDQVAYSRVTSIADCRATDSSFFYDATDTYLYIHFADYEPPLAKVVTAGVVNGFCLGGGVSGSVFDGKFYEDRLSKVFSIKKSIDPLYFGLHKYQQGNVALLNHDGFFDDWRSRNMFGQAARILVGQNDDVYADFDAKFEGFIEDDSRSWTDMSITLQDLRKGLTQPVATNKFTKAAHPYLDDSDVDAVKPVAYGKIFSVKPVCINQTQSTSTYTFLLADTTYNYLASIDQVRVKGTIKSAGSVDLNAGTFTLTSTQLSDGDGNKLFDDVRVDFTAGTIVNGVNIIKDLMYRYDQKNFIASFWDLTEVNLAETASYNTSLYIDKGDKKLSACLESVCNDINARMFVKDSGVYTLRIYDAARTPVRMIQTDEWIGDPEITNNGSEYLTSAIVGYKHRINEDDYTLYDNTTYEDAAFAKYKKLKPETFNTGLYEESAAISKSNVLLGLTSDIKDIVTRETPWSNSDLEICDFIYASPTSRLSQADSWGIYEIMGTDKDPENGTVKLTMRYVAPYTYVPIVYSTLIDEGGNGITDENGNQIMVVA